MNNQINLDGKSLEELKVIAFDVNEAVQHYSQVLQVIRQRIAQLSQEQVATQAAAQVDENTSKKVRKA